MKPVRTTNHNFVYRGPQEGISDLWVERKPVSHQVLSSWKPEEWEIKMLADGSHVIELGIYGMEPIPPVSVAVVPRIVVSEDEPPKTTEEVIEQLGDTPYNNSGLGIIRPREAKPFA
jgi:hypothetical protein